MCEGIKRMHTTSKWINWPACLFLYQFVHSRVGHTTFFHSVANLDEEVSLSLLCSINLLTPCNRLQLTLAAVTSPSGMCLTWWPCQLLQGDQDVLWWSNHISLWGFVYLSTSSLTCSLDNAFISDANLACVDVDGSSSIERCPTVSITVLMTSPNSMFCNSLILHITLKSIMGIIHTNNLR